MRRAPLLPLLLIAACSDPSAPSSNPFLAPYSAGEGKADTAYYNPDGIEVEVDLEGDVSAPAWRKAEAPAAAGQFALTYLRQRKEFYLESLAEDSSAEGRVEWQVDGAWLAASEVGDVDPELLTHFRLRGVNAVLLHDAREGVQVGSHFEVPVPKNLFTLKSEIGEACADSDPHLGLSDSLYWYLWNPERQGCVTELAPISLTVSKMFAVPDPVYPEYDRLLADQLLTVVVLFGQIGDGAISDWDPGIRGPIRMQADLEEAGFAQVQDPPLGVRMEKTTDDGIRFQVDLYDARVFSGLDDLGHFDNFQRALTEHELVVYDGHSMLGASDFWARPSYPEGYQAFLYGGCLGYEYYVRPILAGKGGWENLDILSSVVEVSADANQFAAPALAQIFSGIEQGKRPGWPAILAAVRTSVGDSTFGLSGVRDNCYSPTGSRCL